ncbi:MAG TPA: hypothetical protein VMR62_39350 [Bryobacteraceae bacterium]|jgi:hypothetical protein|nr:hypothetical protein [Bryobacteraceae bacterium]
MKDSTEPRPTSPTSHAKIEANRRNAQKSTGPRTPEGKDKSSRNRLVHGLRANKHILPDDEPAEFLLLLQDHINRFQPVGEAEEALVLRIAADEWRLGRTFTLEAGIYRERLMAVAEQDARRQRLYAEDEKYCASHGDSAPPPPPAPDPRDLLARAFNVDCAGPHSLTNLTRYETSIERSVDRCLRRLKAYQEIRRAATPEPAPQPDPAPPNFHSNPKTEGPPPAPSTQHPAPALPSHPANPAPKPHAAPYRLNGHASSHLGRPPCTRIFARHRQTRSAGFGVSTSPEYLARRRAVGRRPHYPSHRR